jgi:deoxyadenosine/deoxycytidine kinase
MSQGYKVVIIGEPVEQWEKSGIFDVFYKDMNRWAYTFQTMAYQSRIMLTVETCERHGNDVDIYILERSIFSDCLFVDILTESGIMTTMEKDLYNQGWKCWKRLMPITPSLFLYLRPSIDVAMKRVEKRARSKNEVAGVTLDYQRKLYEKHDEYFGTDNVECDSGFYIPCWRLETDSDFENDVTERNRLCKLIHNKCDSMGLRKTVIYSGDTKIKYA